jgi:hypothetical protein
MEPSNLISPEQIETLNRLDKAKSMIVDLAVKCENIIIHNSSSAELAKNLIKDSKKVADFIEDRRKEITKPILDFKASIDARAKTYTLELGEAVKELRGKLSFWLEEQEKARMIEVRKLEAERFEQELIRKAEEVRLNKLLEEGSNLVTLTDAQRLVDMKNKEMDMVRQQKDIEDTKTGGLSKTWGFAVIDASIVPREYLSINEVVIRQAIRNGIREIPGVGIFQENKLVVR